MASHFSTTIACSCTVVGLSDVKGDGDHFLVMWAEHIDLDIIMGSVHVKINEKPSCDLLFFYKRIFENF